MHEIRATIPPEYVSEAAHLALAAGIERVTVAEVFVHGPDVQRRTLSVETSTPKARAFVEGFLGSPVFSNVDYTLTSREVRAIVDNASLSSLTRSLSEPFSDIIQDPVTTEPCDAKLYRTGRYRSHSNGNGRH